jgi:hypothetical protein
MKDQSHELARQVVEFYLKIKGRKILDNNFFRYPNEFVAKNKLEKRYQGHSFDIFTGEEVLEIDDYQKHSKKNQKINDGLIDLFVTTYLKPYNVPLYRLQKEEIVNAKGWIQPDCYEYLRKNLF